MERVLKFGYRELKSIDKVFIAVKEVELEEGYFESWEYNNIYFQIEKFRDQRYGTIEIKRDNDGSITKFYLYIGDTYNYFIVEKDVVELFKGLEKNIYNKMTSENKEIDMYKIEYELIKLSNPIKSKSYLFRLKENNIPKEWVEQANNLIKPKEISSASYGNISKGKVNLVDFCGGIPQNIDFIISEEFANRLDRLFICWNNGNKKDKQTKFIDFLYDNFYDKLKINGKYCTINIREKILLLVDIQTIQIIEFKSNYYNIDMSYYNSLKETIDKIQEKINELNEK